MKDERPFIVVSHVDEAFRVICCSCGARLLRDGFAKEFIPISRPGPEIFRMVMLDLNTGFKDVGELH